MTQTYVLIQIDTDKGRYTTREETWFKNGGLTVGKWECTMSQLYKSYGVFHYQCLMEHFKEEGWRQEEISPPLLIARAEKIVFLRYDINGELLFINKIPCLGDN